MQEEVESRTVSLSISAVKFTGRVLKAAIAKYMAHRKEVKAQKARDHPTNPGGKVSMDELQAQYGDVKQMDISDPEIRRFERIAREYGVKYSVFKLAKGKYQVFFKAPNEKAMQAAFDKYSAKRIKRASRPSVLAKLDHFKSLIKNAVVDKTKRKELER